MGRRGPAPDPNSLRRNRAGDAGWTKLPSTGLDEAPEWPVELAPAPSVPELALWQRLWTECPQAHVWQRDRCALLAAVFVRTTIAAAVPGARAATLTAFRQQSDTLLLSAVALRSARFVIDDASMQPAPLLTLIPAPSVRDRMAAGPEPDEDEDDQADDEDDQAEPEDDE